MRYRLRKDTVTGDENIYHIAYGIDVYSRLGKKVKSIKDVCFDKEKMEEFIEQCNQNNPKDLDYAILQFVDSE